MQAGAGNTINHNGHEQDFNYFFRQDISRLFHSFNSTDSLRYRDFVKIWNEMKFYQIFSLPRFFPFDYRFFMKDTLKITVEYLYDKDLDLEVRTASLYTLYGLYIFQMNRPRQKIPVTQHQWLEILQFIDLINKSDHADVEYVFRYLLYSDAFEFCSTYEIVHSNSNYLKSGHKMPKANNTENNLDNQMLSMSEFKSLVFGDELIEQMGVIHEAYLQTKESKIDEIKKQDASGTSNSSSFHLLSTYINTNFKEVANVADTIDSIDQEKDS